MFIKFYLKLFTENDNFYRYARFSDCLQEIYFETYLFLKIIYIYSFNFVYFFRSNTHIKLYHIIG